MDGPERRKFKRMGARFDISYIQVGSVKEQPKSGYTVNLSPGGLYFKTSDCISGQGDLLNVQLTIPPTQGLLEFGGKMRGFARVLRTENIVVNTGDRDLSSEKYGVALEFCHPPKLLV
jgi:hypothetical protein